MTPRARLRESAHLLHILAKVEHALMVGDEQEIGRLLSGVDPIEVRRLARELERIGGESTGDQDALASTVADDGGRGDPPFAPVTELPRWSVKCQ